MKQKNIYFYTNLLAWGLVFLLAGNYVFGWTTPTSDPPDGDLSAPLDMSSTEQTKTGNLIIDSLLKVGRYSSAPTGATGALYYDTTENAFKGYKSAAWADLGGTAPVSSVFGRTGAIVASTGDYTVSKITGAAPLASPTFTGTVTAPTFSGTLSGNASTATKLQTARTINGVSFNGTANITIPGGTLSCTIVTCTNAGALNCTASCGAGTTVTGGGFKGNSASRPFQLYPSGNGWHCYGDITGTCYAVCCEI